MIVFTEQASFDLETFVNSDVDLFSIPLEDSFDCDGFFKRIFFILYIPILSPFFLYYSDEGLTSETSVLSIIILRCLTNYYIYYYKLNGLFSFTVMWKSLEFIGFPSFTAYISSKNLFYFRVIPCTLLVIVEPAC